MKDCSDETRTAGTLLLDWTGKKIKLKSFWLRIFYVTKWKVIFALQIILKYIFSVELLGSSSLDLKSCHANNSLLFSKIILLTSPHPLRPPDFAWPATLRRVPSGGVAATTTSLRFINEIFIPPRGLIIHRYNPESDIRQSPWNNHFPFAHNTLIIHVFSASRSLRPSVWFPFSTSPPLFFLVTVISSAPGERLMLPPPWRPPTRLIRSLGALKGP